MSAKRRNSGEGSIRRKVITRNEKEYSYWEARLTVGKDPRTNKQIQKTFTGKTQKEVREKMQAAAVAVKQYKDPCLHCFWMHHSKHDWYIGRCDKTGEKITYINNCDTCDEYHSYDPSSFLEDMARKANVAEGVMLSWVRKEHPEHKLLRIKV